MKYAVSVRKNLAVMLCLFLLVLFYIPELQAAEPIVMTDHTSLAVYCENEGGEPLEGISYSLYRVADVSADTSFLLTGDFAAYPVNLQHLDTEDWRALAQTLAAYASADNIVPLKQKSTGQNGQSIFSDLPAGLYLLAGDSYEERGTWMQTAPLLVSLPNQTVQGEWDYTPVVMAKQEPAEQYTARHFIKVWDDGGDVKNRPAQIEVELLKNGTVYDRVSITASDNWRHSWSNLPDDNAEWQVVERNVAEPYTVQYVQEGNTFIMTNTAEALVPGSENPESPNGTPGENPTADDSIPETDGVEILPTGVPQGDKTLPQTGQLWWPVPVLAALGLMLFMVGWKKNQKEL